MKYFNIKNSNEVETIDEINPKDFSSFKDFKLEIRRLANEYHLAGINVYISSRCTKCWSNKYFITKK